MNKNSEVQSKRNSKISSKEDAPLWMLNNEHLTDGYRVNFKSKQNLVKTMCMKHNEITHIWTHLIGFLIFIVIMIGLIYQRQQDQKIYKELKDDFHKFHLEKFNDEFVEDITNFMSKVKSEIYENYDKSHMVVLKNKLDTYYNHLLNFKQYISKDKHVHLESYENHLSQIKDQNQHVKNIQQLQYVNDAHFKENLQQIFNSQKQQILSKFPKVPELEYYPILIYILSAALCLGFSTVYHIFRPLSKKTNDLLYRLDVGGISILIFGSSFVCSYYIYYCYPNLQLFYGIVEFVTCFSVFIITYLERFNKKEFVHIKGMLFGALGLGNGLSLGHAVYIFKIHENSHVFDYVFLGTILMGVLYLTGLFFFVKKIPESLIPKKFDIWLNSHTIFHIFVFIAAIQYYFTLQYLYQLRSVNICKQIKQLKSIIVINLLERFLIKIFIFPLQKFFINRF